MEQVMRSEEEYMMMSNSNSNSNSNSGEEEILEVRRGPWTVEEDLRLINYIGHHGEGRWNSLATSAGLNRTGKSCRLRWLNYLRPDLRRGNITLQEQLLILQLHSRWGNRWSKIAQHLPGRTDNEIKNYWRTRVQKHAKQLKCDVNSKQFKDTMRYLWMPRLVERIQASSAAAPPPPSTYLHQDDINTQPPLLQPDNNTAYVMNSAASSSDSFNSNQNQDDYYSYFSQGLDLIDDEHSISINSSSQWMEILWNGEDDMCFSHHHYCFNTTNNNV